MNDTPKFRQLFLQTLAAMSGCAAVVAVCYVWVDRPVARFVYDHKFFDFRVLKWLTDPPPLIQAWTPAVLTILMVRRAYAPFRRWELALAAACVSMVVADQFRESLSYLFGRYWPETWIDDNPSYIQSGAYGFHPFHGGSAYGSFPSGHMARTASVAAVVWHAATTWRWACLLSMLAMAAALLGMNYHFVSDVIAGAVVGGIVGTYASAIVGLHGERDERPS